MHKKQKAFDRDLETIKNEIIKVKNGNLEEDSEKMTEVMMEYFEIIAGSTGSVQLGMCVRVGLHLAHLVQRPTIASSSSSNSGSNNNKSGNVYVFEKKEEDEIGKNKVRSFTKLADFLTVCCRCSNCSETDVRLFNYGSSGDELGFGHAMWYDSVIEYNGRCFYIRKSGNWNNKTYLLDEHTPKLTLKDTGTTDIDSAISINGFPNMVQNNLNCFTLQNCGLKTNNHCILPVQVKSCWKIYKG